MLSPEEIRELRELTTDLAACFEKRGFSAEIRDSIKANRYYVGADKQTPEGLVTYIVEVERH